jgi:hypothetical protein
MVMQLTGQRGGFRRKVQLSLFIRDYLALRPGTGHEIYIAYKEAVQSPSAEFLRVAQRRIKNAVAKSRRTQAGKRVKITKEESEQLFVYWFPSYIDGVVGRTIGGDVVSFTKHNVKKTRCINYNGFMHYLYVMRQLGLVEYTGDQAPAQGKSDSSTSEWHETHPSVMIQAVAGELGNPAWQNIWKAYLG